MIKSERSFRSKDLLQFVQKKLNSVLLKQLGSVDKFMYIEDDLAQLVNFIFQLKFQSQFRPNNHITGLSLFKFADSSAEHQDISKESAVVFFLKPTITNMRKVAEMILGNQRDNIKKEYLVLLCPKKTFLCMDQLETQGVAQALGDQLRVLSFNFDLIPVEQDLLSLQLEHSFYDLEVCGNQSVIQIVSESILKLQCVLGTFQHMFAKGKHSNNIVDIVRTKYLSQKFERRDSEFEVSLFVFDRASDLITPMLTPFTYQGLVDSIYNIERNQINIPKKLVGEDSSEKKPYAFIHSQDVTYPVIRSMYITGAKDILTKRQRDLRAQIQNDKKGATTQQLHQLTKTKLRQLIFAQNHLSICMDVFSHKNQISFINRVEMEMNMLNSGNNALDGLEQLTVFNSVENWLKLVSLASGLTGGIKQKTLRNIEQILIRSYGVEHALTFKNLHNSGLIQSYISKGPWTQIKKQFNLINDSVDLDKPDDYSYIFILYASLFARMVEEGLTDPTSWTTKKQKYGLIKGATSVYHEQPVRKHRKKLCFVYFIGGVTYSQIESLRFLGRKLKQQIIICTTQISNGSRLIKQCALSIS